MGEPRIGLVKRMKLTRQISLNMIEPAYKDAIERFGRNLSDDEKRNILGHMQERTSFSKLPKILQCDMIQAGLGAGVLAAGSGNLASCVIGLPLSIYGALNLARSIASWNYPCYFPKPVHRIFLTHPSKKAAFHEAVHFLEGVKVIKNDAAIEGIAIAASMLYDGGERYLEKLREDIKEMNFIAGLFANSHYKSMGVVNMIEDARKRSGVDAAWDNLYFMSQ